MPGEHPTIPSHPLLFLGAGGATPRVEVLHGDSHQPTPLLTLSHGHSSYAMSINPSRTVFAVGTKGGSLHLVNLHDLHAVSFRHGASILSLQFLSDTRLAVSDAAGRCLLWEPGTSSLPIGSLEIMGKGNVCALLAPDGNSLFGLTSTGEILEWRLPEGTFLSSTQAPRPPAWGGLVNLAFCPVENTLAYGARGGDLVRFCPKKRIIRVHQAHEGDFYALALSSDKLLLTAGSEDGRLRVWRMNEDAPCKDIPAPRGIISMTALTSKRFLLVDTRGTASIALLDEEHLHVENQLPGSDYRMVLTGERPCEELHSSPPNDPAELVRQIEESIRQGDASGLPERYALLESMGFRHVVLALRADEAEKSGDIPTALALRSELLETLPADRVETGPILLRHACLLEQTGLFKEAVECFRRLQSVAPGLAEQARELKSIRECSREKDDDVGLVLHLQTPLPVSLDLASRMNMPYTSRVVLKEGNLIQSHGVDITPEEVLQKLEQIRGESGGPDFIPNAKQEEVVLVTDRGMARRQLITCEIPAVENVSGLQLAYQMVFDGKSGFLVPTTLLDTGKMEQGLPARTHNENALECLNALQAKATVWSARLDRVDGVIRKALNRIINKKLSERRSKSW